jgi:diamine N-acetyltransferase
MKKRFIAPIENDVVRLRLLREEDLPLTLAWRNLEHIRRWFFNSDLILPDQHAGWFHQYQERDDDFVFIIEEAESHFRPVGQVALYHIDWEAKKAEYGRLMIGDPAARGKGLARSATDLILQIGFQALGLDEIYLEVFSDNEPAIRVYQSSGFQMDEVHDNIVRMKIHKPQP